MQSNGEQKGMRNYIGIAGQNLIGTSSRVIEISPWLPTFTVKINAAQFLLARNTHY